ncbi:hypothetical protein H6F43_12570 [Leptolyngbya sp. FACHB-36]|uniref:hypothetical protein n=1 Tax=Leptolyngbya sp. FACHB-36 TaxID=2692808 RepID=UPI001680A2B8|nr:hypothetical protein [Leptolyngbya sp. FACHB-36]MBD2021013.1 hypothetical protein [Leptolyngbya sp. FACHB-36]
MHTRKPRTRKPTSKELDLLLLAGCSCLLTLLHHPIADGLQSSTSVSRTTPIAAQVSRTSSGPIGSLHLTLPPEREKIRDDEEDA